MVQKRQSNFALLTWLAVFVCLTGSGRGAIEDSFIEFNSIAPAGFTLTECWEAMGMDPQENIYIGFVANSPNGEPQDNVIFKYNPNTGVKKCLGTLRTVAKAANNLGPCQYWSQPEAIPKGHTHFPYFNGKMYLGTQSFHDVVNEGPSALPNYRGAHIFTIDVATEKLTDLSASQPKGVFVENQGLIDLAILPKKNLLVGCTHPFCDIFMYNVVTGEIKTEKGIAAEAWKQINRDIAVTQEGYVYWSYGFGSVDIYRYNMNTNEKVQVGNSGGCGFMNGSDYASDGRVYISDYCNLYEVDRTANQIVKRANMQMSTIWGIVLSRDERRIYGTPIGGTLYEYDCDKNTLSGIYKITSVNTNSYTGSGMCDSKGRIYFSVHSGGKGTEGLLQIDVSERTGPAPSTSAGEDPIPRAVMQPGGAAVGPASIAGVYDIRGSLARRSSLGVLVDTGKRARHVRLQTK